MENITPKFRYPGPTPFKITDEKIFFGRDEEIVELLRLIRLEDCIVVFGKSGLGKSSLINAGIIPQIEKLGEIIPIKIRFGASSNSNVQSPLQNIINTISNGETFEENHKFFENISSKKDSIWHWLKLKSIKNNNKGFILYFDQFEELFTYPKDMIDEFASNLSELFFTVIPENIRTSLSQLKPNSENNKLLEIIHIKFPFKIILTIKSDRISDLYQLKPFLPKILENSFELKPLTNCQAEDATLNPAYDNGEFVTQKFDFENSALDKLFSFLSNDGKEDIEPYQLQLICEYLEKNVILNQNKKLITLDDLGDPDIILKNYYLNKINEISNYTGCNLII